MRERIWSSKTKSYIRPLPQRLGVSPRGCSRRLERVSTDFGCEHSFAKATESVQEHYGFEIGAPAIRSATLKNAQRARESLQKQYNEPFRILPEEGVEQLITQTDGTMICTVSPGPRKGKRPREWKEMRLVAAQAKDSSTTSYAATIYTVEQTSRRWGHCTRDAGWGLNSQIHALGDGAQWIRIQSHEIFGQQGTFLLTFIMSVSISVRPQKLAVPPSPIHGAGLSRNAFDEVHWTKFSRNYCLISNQKEHPKKRPLFATATDT